METTPIRLDNTHKRVSATIAPLAVTLRNRQFNALILGAILCVYVVLAGLFATRVTPFNAPDEPAHFNYVRDVGNGHLPILNRGDWDADLLERLKSVRFPPGSDISPIRYESHQPPLYYILLGPFAALTAQFDEHSQVRAVRLASVLIGAGALFAIFLLAHELLPGNPSVGLLAVGIAAAIPMRIAVTASVSNDGLAELLMTLVLWQSVSLVRRGITARRTCVLGLLVGLGLLTKLTLVVAVPIASLAIVFASRGTDTGRRRPLRVFAIARSLVITGGCAALVVLPWWIRGALVYGWNDPLGLLRHDEVVTGQPLTGTVDLNVATRFVSTLFRSFWGQFGWMGVVLDDRIYLFFAIVTATLLVSTVLWLFHRAGFRSQCDYAGRTGSILLILSIVGIFMGMVGYNLTYIQPQGRYLFPAMGAIAILSAAGIHGVLPTVHRVFAFGIGGLLMIGLDAVILFRIVEPALRY